jgi:hypothetical protein
MADTHVSLKKRTKKVGLALCEHSRGYLNLWADNGFQKPTAMYSSIRLTYDNPDHLVADIPRSSCISVQFVMPLPILKRLDELAEKWGKSRSEAADICLMNAEEMARVGMQVRLSVIMPLDREED